MPDKSQKIQGELQVGEAFYTHITDMSYRDWSDNISGPLEQIVESIEDTLQTGLRDIIHKKLNIALQQVAKTVFEKTFYMMFTYDKEGEPFLLINNPYWEIRIPWEEAREELFSEADLSWPGVENFRKLANKFRATANRMYKMAKDHEEELEDAVSS